MKVYTIIGGVNGVGKSSFSGVLRQQRLDLGKIIDPDHIAAKEHCNKLEAGRIAEESLYRIANRVRKGGHNIAEADVRRRYEKRFADLSKILPYCDEAHFFDNENGFTEAAIYQNGSLIPVCEVLPQWLQTFRSLFLK